MAKKPVKNKRNQRTKTSKQSSGSSGGLGVISKIVDFFRDERTHFVVGIILAMVVLYVFMSFVSYFFTGAADKSVFDNNTFREALAERYEVKNWTSVMGAYLSETFIDNLFGISSFAILFFLVIVSLRLMRVKVMPIWVAFLHSFFWLIWLSVLLGFVANLFPAIQPSFFALGGSHGNYIAVDILNSFIGRLGTALSLIAGLIVYMVFVWGGTIPFLKNIFVKEDLKHPEEDAPVAVGTETVPEEWIVEPKSEEVQEKEPLRKTASFKESEDSEDVEFEVNVPKSDVAGDKTGKDADSNSNYSVAKLGKYDPTLDLSRYQPPTLELLKKYSSDTDLQVDVTEQNANKDRIITTLRNFGIEIKSIKATVGPTITLYEIVPKSGIRISKIRNLESDIMLSLAATGIRIIAPIPGKGTIGIEVPNKEPKIVSMRSIIASKKFADSQFILPIAFGKTITNEIFIVDLTKMPHLLVAGATGQGKSVGLNAMITSLLYKKHPSHLKFVLIDPKKVEFSIYGAIEKHFLAKLPDGDDAIITDTTQVVQTLNSLCIEMDDRYDLLKKAHVRNIREYNEKFINRELNPEKGHRFLPYIVVIVDEFGDLIMTAGKEVEMPIARIAQLARAVGIHMIIATQRPSVNIITGVIKANFPARMAFRVSSMIDSRTILDAPGANQLVGRGDMLFSQGNDLTRVQCAFVDTPEVERIAQFIGDQRGYPTAFYLPEYIGAEGEGADPTSVDMAKRDPLFEDVARMVVATQQGSTSMIQRKFSIGYNRAGRLTDQLEVAGIVGPSEGSKARQVLVQTEYELEQLLNDI